MTNPAHLPSHQSQRHSHEHIYPLPPYTVHGLGQKDVTYNLPDLKQPSLNRWMVLPQLIPPLRKPIHLDNSSWSPNPARKRFNLRWKSNTSFITLMHQPEAAEIRKALQFDLFSSFNNAHAAARRAAGGGTCMNGSYRLLIIRHEPHTPAALSGVPRAGGRAPRNGTRQPCRVQTGWMDGNWMEGWRR